MMPGKDWRDWVSAFFLSLRAIAQVAGIAVMWACIAHMLGVF